MKRQQVNKLYSQLTPQQQAALVFEAVIRKDTNEADLILDSVKIKSYSMPDLDYQQRMQGLSNLSGVYGMIYWKTLFLLRTFTSTHCDTNNFPEAATRYIKRLNSIEVAITNICEQLTIDVLTIKKVAECSDYSPNFGDEIDQQFIEQYSELFSKVTDLN